MTGRTDFPIVVEAVNRGEVLRVLQKPFEPRLREVVRDAFGAVKEWKPSGLRNNAVESPEAPFWKSASTRNTFNWPFKPSFEPRRVKSLRTSACSAPRTLFLMDRLPFCAWPNARTCSMISAISLPSARPLTLKAFEKTSSCSSTYTPTNSQNRAPLSKA